MPTTIDRLLKEVKLKKLNPTFGYVSVYPNPAQASLLDRWLRKICYVNLSTPKDEFHVTLMYDKRNVVKKTDSKKPKKGRLFKAVPVNVEVLFPKNKGEHGVLVLLLDSKDLNSRHKQLKSIGFKHSYPEFKPHITLKDKNVSKSDLKSTSANLGELMELLPELKLFREDWEEIHD